MRWQIRLSHEKPVGSFCNGVRPGTCADIRVGRQMICQMSFAMRPGQVRRESRPQTRQAPRGMSARLSSSPGAVKAGGKLFRDTLLSTNGMSCASCYEGRKSYQPSFAQPFPHKMAMAAETYGTRQLHLDEVIQFCMVGPMAAKPLEWRSAELANLAAFMSEEHKKFRK